GPLARACAARSGAGLQLFPRCGRTCPCRVCLCAHGRVDGASSRHPNGPHLEFQAARGIDNDCKLTSNWLVAKATTVRFTDEMFERLDQASARTGMPVNSIDIAACLEWMQRHTPTPSSQSIAAVEQGGWEPRARAVPPRWATILRAGELAAGTQ